MEGVMPACVNFVAPDIMKTNLYRFKRKLQSMFQLRHQIYLFILFLLVITSCSKEKFLSGGDFKLRFSTDTVSFDTIFSSIGSTTKWLTVRNPNGSGISVPRIYLAGGEKSPFRININGTAAPELNDVKISSGDSIYIFIEVTVNPTGQNNPLVIQDSIVFDNGNSKQRVMLIAFGQDFHLLEGEVLKTQHWKNDKPYLVYNSVLVDSLHTLTIDPGCRVYFHRGSSLFVKGTLKVEGTLDEPVKFLGDRLEHDYDDVPGQWGAYTVLTDKSKYIYGGIHFLKGSKDNVIDYAVIKNANKGIQIDSLSSSDNPMLVLKNSVVENMTLNCIDARTTQLKASNCVFANSGSYAVALRFGGNYEFDHCTVANYSSFTSRNEPSVILNNYYAYNNTGYVFDLSRAYFGNCILYGSMDNEIVLDKYTGSEVQFNYQFQHCLIRTSSSTYQKDPNFSSSLFNKDPKFVNIRSNNFSLDSISPARNIGDKTIASQFPKDLNGNSRLADQGPDLGALEWVPSAKKK